MTKKSKVVHENSNNSSNTFLNGTKSLNTLLVDKNEAEQLCLRFVEAKCYLCLVVNLIYFFAKAKKKILLLINRAICFFYGGYSQHLFNITTYTYVF